MGASIEREGGMPIRLLEKVGVPEADAVEERRLIDDVVAARHRGFGLRGGGHDSAGSRFARDRRDLPSVVAQALQVILLVLVA
jgi:hypothetical protein